MPHPSSQRIVPSRTIIIDDDPASVRHLADMLAAYSDITVVGSAATARRGLEIVYEKHPDILFLDIDLPDGNGLEMMKQLAKLENPPYVIMYTGYYPEYSQLDMVFRNGECDYLLKPINPCELDKTIQRYRHTSANGGPMASLHMLNSTASENRMIMVLTSSTSEMRILRTSDIGYFRYNSQRKIWEVMLNDRTIISLKRSSTAPDILGYSDKFIQTHQSYIVNIDYVLLLSNHGVNLHYPFENDEIPVGRTYFKNLQKHFLCL